MVKQNYITEKNMYREAALKKEEYQVLEELGRGSFGTVFRCFHRTPNQFYAAKLIDKRLLLTVDRRCLEMEAKAMTFLSTYPNNLLLDEGKNLNGESSGLILYALLWRLCRSDL